MESPPTVSIVINNYNYGRFLRQAIDSALGQSHRPLEVIVVDDGSSDDSRAVITTYGQQIIAVLKENGGQASAFNAGLACCTGEIIIFLDADDVLHPEIAKSAAAAFQQQPDAAKLHYRLEVISASGESTGQVRPPWQQPLPAGDLKRQVLSFPDDIPWQPTSGNAFAAWVLKAIFPVPEAEYRICADYYLSNLPPLFGKVIALDAVGAYYRVHSANNHHRTTVDLHQTRQIITRTCHTHQYIHQAAGALGLAGYPAKPGVLRSVSFLANRLVSRKLDPQRHPLAADTLASLTLQGIRAAWGRFDLSWPARLTRALWFIALLAAPRPAARWLANRYFYTKRPAR